MANQEMTASELIKYCLDLATHLYERGSYSKEQYEQELDKLLKSCQS